MGDLYTKRQAKAGSVKRGLSPNLWGQVNLTEINNGGISEGFGVLDDFVSNAGLFLLAQVLRVALVLLLVQTQKSTTKLVLRLLIPQLLHNTFLV